MASFIGEALGKLAGMIGFDGVAFRPVHVDEAGDLQIDVLASGLPTGAATEATLATMATEAKLELVRLLLVSLAGVDFATGTDIGTVLTELALKADLTETQPVSAASLPLPTGASTEATISTLATEAKLELVRLLLVSLDGVDFATGTDIGTVLTELALKADLTETQPVSAAELPLPAGAATSAHQLTIIDRAESRLAHYVSRIMQRNVNTNAGVNTRVSGSGPIAGETWVITGMSAYNDNNAVSNIFMGVQLGANDHWVNSCGAVPADTMLTWSGELVFVFGDVPSCYFLGNTVGDDLFFFVYGYKRET